MFHTRVIFGPKIPKGGQNFDFVFIKGIPQVAEGTGILKYDILEGYVKGKEKKLEAFRNESKLEC